MSSRPAEPRSIASQLVFLFTLAAAFLLFCGLSIFYLIAVRHAFAEDNAVLADKVAALRADLKKSGQPRMLSDQLETAPKRGLNYWVRVLGPDGNTIVETPGMNDSLPPDIFRGAQELTPRDHRVANKLFSLVTTPVEAGGQIHTLQVAQDRSEDEEFRKQFGALLAAGLALGVIASAGIAMTVTKRGLRPLDEMTRSLERIGPARLHERLLPAKWPRELKPLAAAFDDMLDRLESSFTRLSQFSADLAHELRTPVANILGEAQVALTRSRSTDEYREVVESLVTECERLSGIIDKLLFLARAEAADKTIQRSRFDGRAAIEKIAAVYETLADDQQVKIVSNGQAELDADPMLFNRAVSNLLENALRFTPPNGTIHISIAAVDSQTKVAVRDTGSGIAAHHLPRIFDRFYRVDASRSPQGAGLGLALVKSITDLHGGSAEIESRVGGGTTVTLIFPNSSPSMA